jgi:hypothetical protein
VLKLAGTIDRQARSQKRKEHDDEQDHGNFNGQPVGPGMRRIGCRQPHRIQKCISGPG